MGKTGLMKAIEALQEAGFTVDRAHEEEQREANGMNMPMGAGGMNTKTGAILIRCTPVKEEA